MSNRLNSRRLACVRGGLVLRTLLRRVSGSKPNSTDSRSVWRLLHAKSYVLAKRPPVGVVRKFGEGVPAQMSSRHLIIVLGLRGPFKNRPPVVPKLDANLTPSIPNS
ncbi:hypothetical protein AVEN_130335-1 [Araneus ventricosus]|uniref:Uncharacterized protein n=1 Tax=Araneus ventricosus TaxID=182803 RepID=A0A4Y2BDD7_ARAVE|nr:hypothetical protein AVEN_130335-1 [Araneus ventricosus]